MYACRCMIDGMYECRCECFLEMIPSNMCVLDKYNVNSSGEIETCNVNKIWPDKDENVITMPRLDITYDKLNGRPSLDLNLKGRKVLCLLDTGAKVNVIIYDYIKDMNLNFKETNRKIICANESDLKHYGVVSIKVRIGNECNVLDFYVVDRMKPEIIAGVEFLDAFHIYLKKVQKNATVNALTAEEKNVHKENKLKKLSSLFEKETNHQIIDVIKKFESVFMTHKWDIGKTSMTQHRIETQSEPILVKPYRQPRHLEEKMNEALENLQTNGIIEKCSSPWNSPLVCVWKKDKKEIRVCVDFRQLNKVTLRPAFPMPNIEDMINVLNGAKYFSTIDLGNAYYQVELDEESKDKTAFSTKMGQFRFKRMPFGIAAAPATFQRLMTTVLGDLNWNEAVVYMDDILIFSATRDEHINRLNNVLNKIKESGLKVNPEKCRWMLQETKFLGYIINENGIKTDESKIDAINNFKSPTCIKHLRSFLGLTNYYRKFVKNYAKYSKILESLCGKDKKLFWSDECISAFENMKQQLKEVPILAFPDFSKPFILDTDASFDTIGAVLSQKDDQGRERVIAYGSHKMNKHEVGYCITRKELLAIYYFTIHFKHYLYGKKFVLRTDHKAITFMLNTKNPLTPQFQTWINFLSGLDITLEYRKGTNHNNADALSRNSYDQCTQCKTMHEDAKKGRIKTRILALSENKNEIKWQQNNREIREIVNNWELTNDSKWIVKEGIVMDRSGKIWIPKDRREEFINDIHQMLCHAGHKKVFNYVKDDFDMEKLSEYTKNVIKTCIKCQKRKTMTTKTKELIINQDSNEPFEKIYIDYCGPFKKNIHGKQYIFAIIDRYTRLISITAVTNQDENTTCKCLLDKWIYKYGSPAEIHMDKGKAFVSNKFNEVLQKLRIKPVYSSPYHHNTNGIIERQFRTIRDAINTRMKDGMHKDWSELIPEIEFMLNSTIQATLGKSPAEMVFGRKIKLWWKSKVENIETTKQNSETTKRCFEIGERVLIKKDVRNKEDDRYIGPATILNKRHDRSYEMETDDKRILIRNVEWLKPYNTRGM